MVPEPGPIEDDSLDASGFRPLGDETADHASLLGLRLLRAAKLLFQRGCRSKRPTRQIDFGYRDELVRISFLEMFPLFIACKSVKVYLYGGYMFDWLTAPVASVIGASIGAWGGAQLALQRFKRERAFDRRLDWYERMIRTLYDAATELAIAKTFEWDVRDGAGTVETAVAMWRKMQLKHLEVNKTTAEGVLYAREESFVRLWEATGVLQELADATDAFNGLAGEALPSVRDVIRALRRAADDLAMDMRSQLRYEQLELHPRDRENASLPPAG